MNGNETSTVKVCLLHGGIEKELLKITALLDERKRQTEMRFDLIEKHRIEIKELMEHRLSVMNDLQRKMDAMTRVFASKESLEGLQKLVYIGLGIAMALHFIFGIAVVWLSRL